MKEKIEVQQNKTNTGWEFQVTVGEGTNQTRHKVTMNRQFYESLDAEVEPEEVLRKSFKFLLEREPKESILSKFDITVISKYFPEYEGKLKERLLSDS